MAANVSEQRITDLRIISQITITIYNSYWLERWNWFRLIVVLAQTCASVWWWWIRASANEAMAWALLNRKWMLAERGRRSFSSYPRNASQCVCFSCSHAFMCLSSVVCTYNTHGLSWLQICYWFPGASWLTGMVGDMPRGPWMPEPTQTRLQAMGSNVIWCTLDLQIRPMQALRELLLAFNTEWGYGNSVPFAQWSSK